MRYLTVIMLLATVAVCYLDFKVMEEYKSRMKSLSSSEEVVR